MGKVIRGKSRTPGSVCYNSWVNIGFPLVNPSGAGEFAPIPLNLKILMVTYTCQPLNTPGGFFLNLISGVNVAGYQGTGAQASHGYFDLAGTYAAGDTITVTVAGVAYPYVVPAVYAGNNTAIASGIVSSLTNNPAFSALYIANSLGAEVVVQLNTYSTATPTFAVTVASVSGTATANGANMIAGVAGALPTQPVSDQTNNGAQAKSPSGTAVDGNALFPVDIVLPMFNLANSGKTGVIYATKNFDAIWPAASSITLVPSNPGIGSASLTSSVWGVPVDNHPALPQLAAFLPAYNTL